MRYIIKKTPNAMKYYTRLEAELLMAFYSDVERIECQFKLVHKNNTVTSKDLLHEKVGILCVDKTTTPPLIAELDDVVKGLELTPTTFILQELRQA